MEDQDRSCKDGAPIDEQPAEGKVPEADAQANNNNNNTRSSTDHGDPVQSLDPTAAVVPGNRSVDAIGELEAQTRTSDLLGASFSVLPVGHPGINTVACNDKLVCSKPVRPGEELCVCEQLFRLVPKAVVTAAGQVPYMGIQAVVDVPHGFQLASKSVIPSVSPELPEEDSFRVIAFDEAMCLGYTEEDGVTPRYHFDVAEMRQEPQFRVCKQYFDMKCAAVLAQQAPPPSESVGEDDDGGESVIELPCSALLEQFSSQGLFGDAFDSNTVVLGMTACKVLGFIMSPPRPAQAQAAGGAGR